MHVKHHDNRSTHYAADFLVDHRRFLVVLVFMVTAALLFVLPGLDTDKSLKSMFVTGSPAYARYEKFIENFGNEEFILVAIKNPLGADDPRMLTALARIVDQVAAMDTVEQVLSLANVTMLQKRGERFGNFPVVVQRGGSPGLPDAEELATVRKALPLMDLLVSPDLKTVGMIIKLHDDRIFDTDAIRRLLASLDSVVKNVSPPGSEVRVIGPAVLRQAVVAYSIRTALVFGILCTIICTVVTVYCFRSILVTLVTMIILGLCALWILGLMSLLRIPLNSATSISFGLVLITTLEIVIHVIVRYSQFRVDAPDKVGAVRETVRYLAKPCLMCSATAAVGFGTCMITPLPMVFQLGLIMSVGILISYCLAMILAPAFIMETRFFDSYEQHVNESGDLLSRGLNVAKRSILLHHRAYTLIGLTFTVVMFAGVFFIRSDPQILRQLKDSNPELQDIRFVGTNLSSVHTLELIVEAEKGAFKQPEIWKSVMELEERLKQIPEVVAADSLLPFVKYTHRLMAKEGSRQDELFAKPGLISQLLMTIGLSNDGKRMIKRYLSEDSDRLRISIRIKNSDSASIGATIKEVKSAAESALHGRAMPVITGALAVVASQGDDLIKAELKSMILALGIITLLMMIQMGTPLFGLVSLIPNIPPLATVFGIMGWFDICLDGVTVFAATVAVGLAVDNTIHFVAQLKREMKLNPRLSVEQGLFQAYDLAGKPMAAWSIVTCLGFLAMLATPFRASENFGILVASAVFMGIFGDLIFMQSIILRFPWVRNLIARRIARETGARENLPEDS